MAYKDPEIKKAKNREWYLKNRANNAEYKSRKKEYDREFHLEYRNPNLTPEKSREYQKNYRDKHREEIRVKNREQKRRNYARYREQNRQWQLENRDKVLGYRKKYRESGKQWWSQVKSRYGITQQQYNDILRTQNNVCPICNNPFEERKFCVDHCHVTGQVRGILHRECNLLIGFAKDDTKILQNAINYLNYETPDIKTSEERIGESLPQV